MYTDLSYPFYAAATKKRKPSLVETITTLLSSIHDSLTHCSFSTNGVFLVWFWNSLQTDKLHDAECLYRYSKTFSCQQEVSILQITRSWYTHVLIKRT